MNHNKITDALDIDAFLEKTRILLDSLYDANDMRSERHNSYIDIEFAKVFVENVGISVASPEFAVHVHLFISNQNVHTLGPYLSSSASRILGTRIVFPETIVRHITDAVWKTANNAVDVDTLNFLARTRVERIARTAHNMIPTDLKNSVSLASNELDYIIEDSEYEALVNDVPHFVPYVVTHLRYWDDTNLAQNPIITLLRDMILHRCHANIRRIADVALEHTKTLNKDELSMDDVIRDAQSLVTLDVLQTLPETIEQSFDGLNVYVVQKLIHALDISHIYRAQFDANVTGTSCGSDLERGEGCSFGDYGLVSAFERVDEESTAQSTAKSTAQSTAQVTTSDENVSLVMTLWSNDRYEQLNSTTNFDTSVDMLNTSLFGSLFDYNVVVGDGTPEIGKVHVLIDDFVLPPISSIYADMVMIPKYVFLNTYKVPPILYLTIDASDGPRSKLLRSGTGHTLRSHITLTLATTASHYFIYKELQYKGVTSTTPFRLSRFRVSFDFPGLTQIDLNYALSTMDRVQIREIVTSTSSEYEYLVYVSVLDSISSGSIVTFYNIPDEEHYIKHGQAYYVERIGNRLTSNRNPDDNTERYIAIVRNDGQKASGNIISSLLLQANSFLVINSLQSTVVLKFTS